MLEYDIEHLRGVIFFRFQKFDSVKNLTENDLIVYKTNKSDKFRTICIDDIKTRFENQIVLLIHQLIKQNYLIKEITLENTLFKDKFVLSVRNWNGVSILKHSFLIKGMEVELC
jgi:hypothetical protein